jgi:restriction system protein
MEAEVERRNLELTHQHEEIDSLLSATLEVDDYVDLTTLRRTVEHPPFDRTDLENPVPSPAPILDPPKPVFTRPSSPQGLKAVFGGNKKHERAVVEAGVAHQVAVDNSEIAVAEVQAARKARADWWAGEEAKRLESLDAERRRYAKECAEREATVAEHNKTVDTLIADLGYGAVHAVQEYVSIVLSNSVYPDHFPVEHDFEFDAATAELRLTAIIPAPEKLTTAAGHKYSKTNDEITSVALTQKACKDRYSGAVHQVALRSLHEVFEADRRGIIKTISLEVGTQTLDPATGQEIYVPFVAVGAERESFLGFDLSNVVPAATLAHLGASVSKNPYGLVAVNASGIRRS